jgi:hypothetical protein
MFAGHIRVFAWITALAVVVLPRTGHDARGLPAADPDQRTTNGAALSQVEEAIRELVGQGAVVKRFEVRETKSSGLLVRLKPVHVNSQGRIKNDLLPPLRRITPLSLELRGLPLGDEGLKSLVENTAMIGLDLSGTTVTSHGILQTAGRMERIELLDLSFTDVGDTGIRSLSSMKRLRYLSLLGSRVSDDGLDSLSKCESLRELYLGHTNITPAGARKLQRLLPHCRIQH